jgi:hypothetical protein
VPTVHVVLQRARTLIENLAGIDEEKEIAKKIEDENVKIEQ